MSSSKQPQSGLKSLTRNWSESEPPSSQPINWPPTPPKPSAPKKLSGAEQRLKDIQDALAGNDVPSEGARSGKPPSRGTALTSTSAFNKKRPSEATDDGAASKKRQLPSSWNDPEPVKAARVTRPSASSSVTVASRPKVKGSGKPAAVFLSQEQTQILKLVQEGNSVFYTGSAGTGKSVLLREIIKTLRKKYVKSPDAVAITASTGIAACNIGGVTIHSFAGIGLGIESAEELTKRIRKNRKASGRWLRTKVLIIDEVSMVDGDLFDKLSRIGSMLRHKTEPFGGIQVIVTGDFFQLPPVAKNSQPKFAFEAQLWNETIRRTFNLTKVFRQRDQEFIDMLNEMRFGRLSPKSIAKFRSLNREIVYEDGIGATELFPRREDVDRSNGTRMQGLQTDGEVYTANDGGAITDPQQREKMLANFMAPKVLNLRVDAQVMLIKNVDETLVNGSMGKIVRFLDPALYQLEGELLGEDKGPGGAKKLPPGGTKRWPVVEFAVPGGVREVMVQPDTWKVELPSGEVQVSRTQLPLILAWAMSIHKSQGQTLERVKVDLGKVFEKGQAYVALSRATSLDGLQVLNFDPNKVNAHPKVAQWSQTLETVELD